MKLLTPLLIASLAATPAFAASRTFDVKGFTGVALTGSHNVEVSQGAFSVTAEGPAADLDRLKIGVDDGVLVVSQKSGSYSSSGHVVVKVRLPALSRMTLTGSGDMKANGVNAKAFEARLTGSGDMILAGTCTSLKASLLGSGDMVAKDLKCESADVSLLGSGDIDVYANKGISASLMGSGDICQPPNQRARQRRHQFLEVKDLPLLLESTPPLPPAPVAGSSAPAAAPPGFRPAVSWAQSAARL